LRGGAAGQGRGEVAVTGGIAAERDGALPIAGEDIGHPASHEASLAFAGHGEPHVVRAHFASG
ncbi:hypothetical protein KCQ60_25110, partial [Mycobacterium tuberculosis]|nr:hypothetical protein [Mycobacterium tuberculosis]